MHASPEPIPATEIPSLRHRIMTMNSKQILSEVLSTLTQSAENAVLYDQFLLFISRFRRYSFYNRLMLFTQYPQGSQFASSFEWRTHKRFIRKDEKSCRIFKPKVRKTQKLDAAGKPLFTAGGVRIDEEHIYGWAMVPVFAYEQTVPAGDDKDVIIPSYEGIVTDDPYHVRASLAKAIESRGGIVDFRNIEFSQNHVCDGERIIINQLYDINSQNLALARDLCRRCMKETQQAAWMTKALDIAELIVAMSIGTPKTQLRTIDIMALHGDIAQLAIGAVDKAMKVLEGFLLQTNE